MKNINHLFWGCVIVLLLSNFRINAQNLIGYADGNGYGAGIFTYPIEGSVIQRVGGNTNFNIMGHIGYGYQDATKYNYVIIAQELEPTTGNPKSPINVLTWNISITNVSSDLGFFNQYVNMPQGWWNLFLNISRKDGTGGTTLCTIKFGVGDIFVIAGQSNARGFTQEAGNPGLISYDNSMNDNGNFDAVRVLGRHNQRENPFNQNVRYLSKNGLPFNRTFEKIRLLKPEDNNPLTMDNSAKNYESPIFPRGYASWCWAPLGKMYVESGEKVPIQFYNVAKDNSKIADWQPNGDNYNQLRDILRLQTTISGFRSILWHQGESDSYSKNGTNGQIATPKNTYTSQLTNLVNSIKDNVDPTAVFGQLNWHISNVSRFGPGAWSSETNSDIIDAQNDVIQNLGKKIGVSTDEIPDSQRDPHEQNHFHVGNGFNSHLNVANRWMNLSSGNKLWDVTPRKPQQGIGSINVTVNNGEYVIEPLFGNSESTDPWEYYWVLNDETPVNVSPTNFANRFKRISTNRQDDRNFYICFVKRQSWKYFLMCQPFVAPNTKDANKNILLRVGSLEIQNLAFSAGLEQKNITVASSNIMWDSADKPSWINLSATTGGFGETQLSISTNQANTTGDLRTATLRVKEYGTTNSYQKNLRIEQSATTGCQDTPLTNLSPTNPNDEWQGYGTMKINQNIEGKPLKVGGVSPEVSGIGTHAYSRLVYNISGYNTFTGKVGMDDEVDGGCNGTHRVKFMIKGNNNPTPLWEVTNVGPTDGPISFTVPVTGITILELIVEPLDNNYCDHADWLDPVLSCGTSTCTIPANPANANASSPTISSGQSTPLNVTCSSAGSSGIWSNGASGNTINVSPTTTTTYTVRCKNGTCESVGQQPVTVTVGTNPPPSGLTAGTCYTISSLTNLSNNMQAMGDGSIQRQGATGAANQIWRAEAGSAANQLKFVSAATNQYITVNTPNYADHMYLASNSNNYQSWNIETSGGNYRLSIPSYNVTWDMEGAGGGQYLQNYGNTSEGFNNWRLWRFQATTCPNTNTSGLTNNSCYIIRSVQTNNPLQAMSDGKVHQQSANGQNNQIWKAEASGNQYMFKGISSNQYIRVNDSNNGTKMEVGAAMAFDMQASGANFRISRNATTWDMEGAGSGVALQNWGTTSEPFHNYRLWSFQNVSCPTTSSNCTNRFVTAGEAWYASTGDGTVSTNANKAGTAIKIGGNGQNSNPTTFAYGVGTHASSEIIYELGGHSFTKFKADVGRDWNSYSCNCGGQSIVFKVINDNNGQLLAGPITKTIWQTATPIEATITGISRIKLVVEDGGDQPWGDWANWANARLECPSVNMRETAITPEEWFWVSPNPNDGKFIAKVNLKIPQSVQLYLSDIKGNIIKEYTFVGVEGMNNFEINIQDKITIESIYNIRCQTGEASDSKRVIVEK